MIEFWAIWFAAFSIGGALLGLFVSFTFLDDERIFTQLLVTFIILFLFAGIGGYSMNEMWEVEIEAWEEEVKCERTICESQGLEFVDYIAEECLCREPKFTLVNGGAT